MTDVVEKNKVLIEIEKICEPYVENPDFFYKTTKEAFIILKKLDETAVSKDTREMVVGSYFLVVDIFNRYNPSKNIKDPRYEKGKIAFDLKLNWWIVGWKKVRNAYLSDIDITKIEGIHIDYFLESGGIQRKCYVKNGKLEGVCKIWYDNGKKKSETFYKNGKKDGLEETWFINGEKGTLCFYKKDKKNGIYEARTKSGRIINKWIYKNDKLDGICESWSNCGHGYVGYSYCKELYKNGKIINEEMIDKYNIKKISSYKNNVKWGIYKEFYEDGTLKLETTYKNGFMNGIYKTWHQNGIKSILCHYKKNELHGVYKTWYENGVKESKCCYKNGRINGEHKIWHHTGKLIEKKHFDNGILHGLNETWSIDDKTYTSQMYRKGIKVEI